MYDKVEQEPGHIEKIPAKVLLGMPQHQITKNFGTAGLERRLHLSLEQAGLADSEKINTALELSTHVHRNDQRSNGHYLDHIFRVTTRIIDSLQIKDEDILAAAILHDSVEDHADELAGLIGQILSTDQISLRQQALIYVERKISKKTAKIVKAVSNPILAQGSDENDQAFEQRKTWTYIDHTRWIVECCPEAHIVKLSDFYDNAVGNHYTHGRDRQHRLDLKYLQAYPLHIFGVWKIGSLVPDQVKQQASNTLKRGFSRAQARLLN